MIGRLFYLIPICAAVLFGYYMGEGATLKKKKETVRLPSAPRPQADFPVREDKPIALIVYGYKNGKTCEKTLRSIFEQDYDHYRIVFFDDASQDGTFEKVQSYVLENQQDHRVILIQNAERLGPVACLYRALSTLSDKEIAVPLDAKDWLAHPKVLSRLNHVYQNPDVWLTMASPLLYPSYVQTPIEAKSDHLQPQTPVSFYAALFKQIRLADLVQEGRFVNSKEAYLKPLFHMSWGRCRALNEPLFFSNLSRVSREIGPTLASVYPPLIDFPAPQKAEEKADIVLFSCDRPMQLFACLESIRRYISGYEEISVLCRASDERFRAGYEQVALEFPHVRFLFQGKDHKKDFKPLLLKALFESSSEYILFGTDDDLAKDYVDLKMCMEAMAKTGAYGFYLRLGSHISYCYQLSREQPQPASIDLGKGIYAWSLHAGNSDWDFPHTLDMTLYRKSRLKAAFESMRYKTPNSLEFSWAKEFGQDSEIGLYFDRSKILNIPLNVVGRTGNPHMNYLTAPELLAKFEQGLKIDIAPLFRIENSSPHFEYYPQFVSR